MLLPTSMIRRSSCSSCSSSALKISTILIVLVIQNARSAIQKEFTVSIDPGNRECFYQHGKTDETIDFEYQVIDGGHGDLDINFELIEPSGHVIYTDERKSDNLHRHDIRYDGDYSFCFDNSFSRFNHKIVFFELIIENENGPNEDQYKVDLLDGYTLAEFYEMKVEDIQDAISKVRANLMKARHLLEFIRNYEARDRNMAEENLFKVDNWSMFQVIMMIAVAGIQVIMLRSLFDTNSKVHKIWKKFS